MKIDWQTDHNAIGNGYGYSNHNRKMREHFLKLGGEITPDAEVTMQICVPPDFKKEPGKFNVLFTMYECQTLPKEWVTLLNTNKPDLIIVPCQHNKYLFERYTDTPVEVCPEGIDIEKYKFFQREFPKDRPFAFLWIGASNPRKGWEHIGVAMELIWKKFPEIAKKIIMIMKTTQDGREERVIRAENVFMDTRDYSLENLITLYEFAHCFVFPTMGEGWGLTLHEAQATGLPCIYTDFSGVKDFMPKEFSYPLKWHPKKINTIKKNADGTTSPYHISTAACPDYDHLVRRMIQVYSDYDRALANGKKACDHVRKFTWDNAAQVLINIIERHTHTRKAVA